MLEEVRLVETIVTKHIMILTVHIVQSTRSPFTRVFTFER